VNVVCRGVGSGTYVEYDDGLIIKGETDATSVFTNKLEKKMRSEDWTCTAITPGACDRFSNKNNEQVPHSITQTTQDEESQRQQAIEKLKGQLKPKQQ
jgi:hypothetical protein